MPYICLRGRCFKLGCQKVALIFTPIFFVRVLRNFSIFFGKAIIEKTVALGHFSSTAV